MDHYFIKQNLDLGKYFSETANSFQKFVEL